MAFLFISEIRVTMYNVGACSFGAVKCQCVSQPGIQYNFEVQYSCTPLTSRPSLLPDFQSITKSAIAYTESMIRQFVRPFTSTYMNTVFLQMYIYAHPFSPGLAYRLPILHTSRKQIQASCHSSNECKYAIRCVSIPRLTCSLSVDASGP